MMNNAPNFFIIGAPKSGTTALATYLSEHSNVFMSEPKEPNWFCDDFPNLRQVFNIESYYRLFSKANNSHKAIGEASTIYLYSKTAVANIYKYSPDSKIIVMVRNPVDLVYSWHSQLVYNMVENELVFEKAWRLQSKRIGHPLLQYGAIGCLGNQVLKLLSIISRPQILFIVFDEFKSDPSKIYHNTLDFLQVPNDGRNSFPKINENKRHRIPILSKFLQNSKNLYLSAQFLKTILRLEKIGIAGRLITINTKKQKRPPSQNPRLIFPKPLCLVIFSMKKHIRDQKLVLSLLHGFLYPHRYHP